MGEKELERLKEVIEVFEFKVKDKGIRFGPSKIYKSNKKVLLIMRIGVHQIECEFFVVGVDVPILLGNNMMVPLGGKIDMEENKLFLNKAHMEIPLVQTKGGHFFITMRSVAGINDNNIKGDEADAVMMMILEGTDDENIKKLQDEVGHNIFVALALTEGEEAQVEKVHRYFGNHSSRRIWDC